MLHPLVEYYKVKNFILEPLTPIEINKNKEGIEGIEHTQQIERGMVSIDGELHKRPNRLMIKCVKGGGSFIY